MLNILLYRLSLLALIICFAGCEHSEFTHHIFIHDGDVDDGAVSTEPVEPTDEPIDNIQTGTVVITDADGNWGNDEYALNNVTITGDTLRLNVSYAGGCKTHQFTLVTSGSFLESSPVQLVISIAHNANDDPCEAYPTEDYHFDLNPIKTLYQEAYQQESGTIILLLEDAAPNTQLVYHFAM